MKLDLNKNIDFLGTEQKNTIGKELSIILYRHQSDDPIKTYEWAVKLHKGESLDLDQSDISKLEEIVKSNKDMVDGFKAQILIEIKKAKK